MALLLLLSAGCRQLLGFEGVAPGDAGSPLDDGRGDGPPVGCQGHDDCLSEACLPDGSCADEADVAYAAAGGSGTACTRTAPCARVSEALTTDRRIIKTSGRIGEPDPINLESDSYVFLADPGASLIREGIVGGPIFSFKNPTITIVGLEISNTSNGDAGIQIDNGVLTLDRVKVIGCAGRGLDVKASNLTITRSVFAANTLGGAVLEQTTFTISNSLFVNNGTPSSTVGGVRMSGTFDGSTFELNTVANNVTDSFNAIRSGVNCSEAFLARSNIVSGNEVSAACTFEHSLFDTMLPAGDGNLLGNPSFIVTDEPTSTKFYRITSESDAIDRGVSAIAFDIDGQPRPLGNAPDVGADEVQ